MTKNNLLEPWGRRHKRPPTGKCLYWQTGPTGKLEQCGKPCKGQRCKEHNSPPISHLNIGSHRRGART